MRFAVTAIVTVGVVAWQASAFASASFPAEVDKDLMLNMVPVESIAGPPGQGCLLCHLSASGGSGTNNAFGTLMKNAGTTGMITGSVDGALAKLEETDPRAITDLEMGMDPNMDPLALNNDPIAQYGCGSIAGSALGRDDMELAPLFALAALGLCRIRRRTALRRPESARAPCSSERSCPGSDHVIGRGQAQ